MCKLRCNPQSYHYIIWLIHAAEKDNTPQPRPYSLLPNHPKWPAAQHMSITSYAAFFYLLTLFLCRLLAATVTEQTSISPPCLFPSPSFHFFSPNRPASFSSSIPPLLSFLSRLLLSSSVSHRPLVSHYVLLSVQRPWLSTEFNKDLALSCPLFVPLCTTMSHCKSKEINNRRF